MNATEQIKRFQEFIESTYIADLMESIRIGNDHFTVDFKELAKFDPELADLVLDNPEEVVRGFEIGIQDLELSRKEKNFRVRINNLPESQEILIRNIRSKHIGKLFFTQGIVRQKSEIRPQVTNAKFECPACGNIMGILQLESAMREPTRCGCGRKGKFKLIGKELVDAQRLVLEEAPENLEGGEQPKRIDVFLKQDLVSPMGDKKTNPGTKINVTGIVKEVPIILRTGAQSTRFDLLVEANHIETSNEDYDEIKITPEEEKEIMELAKDPQVYEKIISSIAPSIYGHEKVKEALMLQLFGGVNKKRSDGAITRGDMHILLIGDPGAGKSQMLKRASIIAPKSRYVSGKGASGAGLTASVVKDEFLKGWSLEAGALVLANKGFCMIDELDKMSKEDTSAMHEALEQQTVTISKANIQATLRCETTVLAAANPKWGRFDPYELIAKQIDMPASLINRFDLIFPIRDMPDAEKDTKLASFILKLHETKKPDEVPIRTELLRKYLSYSRRNVKPDLSRDAIDEIQDYYIKIRNQGGDEGKVKSVPISPRQLEGLIRLSEASAKTRFSNIVEQIDAKRAIELMHFCLSQIGIDPETGKIDIDRITTGISASARNQISIVKDTIIELESKFGKTVPIEEIVREAQKENLSADKVDEVIEKLKRAGDIFEPRRGFISRI